MFSVMFIFMNRITLLRTDKPLVDVNIALLTGLVSALVPDTPGHW